MKQQKGSDFSEPFYVSYIFIAKNNRFVMYKLYLKPL